jgi:hypothetical protein
MPEKTMYPTKQNTTKSESTGSMTKSAPEQRTSKAETRDNDERHRHHGETQLPRMAYNLHETAEILGISHISVWRLCKRGLLKSSSALRHKLIALSEIEKFLKVTAK